MMRRSAGRRPALIIALVAAAGLAGGCGPSGERFITANARAHVNMLAETIGSRPTGSDANRRAREYLIDQLRIAGMNVRVQNAEARRPDIGLAGRVSNIVATRQGAIDDAIALVAHYDSVPDGPGAGDDAFGAAIVVEAARVLGAAGMRHSLMVLITDSEENGLLGAAAAMTDPTIRDRIATYLNFEASGTSGPAMLFETGPGNRWLTSAWARVAPFPRGGSFAVEIYERLPNDTDFSILKRADIPGLNFAIVGDSTAYHTDRDTAARLDTDSLTTAGENAVAIVTALDSQDVRQRSLEQPIYFDFAGRWAFSVGPLTGIVIGVLALAFGVLAWLRVTAASTQAIGGVRVVLMFMWALAGAIAVMVAMFGALWLLRAMREVYHPWYAQMGRASAFTIAAGISVGWLFTRAGALVPARFRGERHPALVWTVALPFWIALAAAALWFAPGAAYLATAPLLAAGVLLIALPARSGLAVRTASIIVLAVAASLWLHNTIALADFINAVFGRFAMIAPLAILPALFTLAALFLAPPFISTVAAGSPGLPRPWIVTSFCLIALAGTGLAAYFGDAYTDRDPLRRYARFVQDQGTNVAQWEIGSNEPGVDVLQSPELQWTALSDATSTLPRRSIPISPMRFPFRFRADAPTVALPATASASVTPVVDGVELTVTVRADDPTSRITLLLPAGVEPVRSNLPGITTSGERWRSIFAAPPADGLVWRIVLRSEDEARIGESGVILETAELPGAALNTLAPGPALPAWMPRATAAWHARAAYLIPVGPLLPAPLLPVPGDLPTR